MGHRHISDEPLDGPVVGTDLFVFDRPGTPYVTYRVPASALATFIGGGVTSVSGTPGRITAIPTTGDVVIDVAATYVGQASITTLGTVSIGIWNGTNIDLTHGGTNASLVASNGGIFYSTGTAGAILGGTATAGQILRSGSSSAPSWSTATYPATTTINQLLYSSSTNIIGQITASNNGVLISGASGIPSWLTAGTTGQVLTATTSNPASWTALSGIAVTSITGTPNQVIASAPTGNVTLSLPQDIATTSTVRFGSLGLGYVAPASGLVVSADSAFGVSGAYPGVRLTVSSPSSGSAGLLTTGFLWATSPYVKSNDSAAILVLTQMGPTSGATGYVGGVISQPAMATPVGQTVTYGASLIASYTLGLNIGIITNLYGVYFDGGVGSGGGAGGTVTNAYGAYFTNPNYGSNKCALYADNLSIGYSGTAPPASGMIISGSTYIGASSWSGKFGVLDAAGGFFFDGSHGTYGSANRIKSTTTSSSTGQDLVFVTDNAGTNSALYITSTGFSYFGSSSAIASGGRVQSTRTGWNIVASDGTATAGIYTNSGAATGNQIMFLGYSNHTLGFSTNNQNAQMVLTPTGQFGVGITTVLANIRAEIYGATTDYCALIAGGTLSATNGADQYGVWIEQALFPTGGASGNVVGLYIDPYHVAPTATTIAVGSAIRIYNHPGSNVGTISNLCGLFIDTGDAHTGTVTNAYGLFVSNPAHGTNKMAAYFDSCVGIGATSYNRSNTLRVNTQGSASTSYEVVLDGTLVQTDNAASNGGQIGLAVYPVFQPTLGSGNSFNIYCAANFIAPSTKTMSGCYGLYIYNSVNSNVGTLSTVYGLRIDGGSVGGGTVTTGVGLSLTIPAHGANRYGLDLLGTATIASGNIVRGINANFNLGSSSGTLANAMHIYCNPLFSSNAATITNAYGLWIDAGATAGTITNGYSGYFSNPNYGTTKCALYADNLNIGYPGSAPPSSGVIISGKTSIGNSSTGSGTFRSTNIATQAYNAVVDGTLSVTDNALSSGSCIGLLMSSVYIPTLGAATCFNMYLASDFRAPSTKTISYCHGIYISNAVNSNVGTISQLTGLYIDGGTAAAGTVTAAYGIYCLKAVGGATNYTAAFVGSTTTLFIDATGLLYPGANKGINLGGTANRFNIMYNATNTTGTSRIGKSQMSCPTCNEAMVRGTGTMTIAGETADYIPCWCDNDACSAVGSVHMDRIKHLDPSKLLMRSVAPKIEFLGFKVHPHSGNSRGIQVKFRYVDGSGKNQAGHEMAIENSTYLTDVEYQEFLDMDGNDRPQYIHDLGLREWHALEESRLMEEDCIEIEAQLNALMLKEINTDLLLSSQVLRKGLLSTH